MIISRICCALRHTILSGILVMSFYASSLALAQAADAPSVQDERILNKVTSYLNNLHTVTAKFLQVAPDGSIRTGTAILQRPGKMRFQYDKPDPQLLVAGFGLLVYHDPGLNQTTNIPLSSTPLSILLAKHVKLSGDGVTVTKIRQPPGEVQISMIRTGKTAEGQLTLIFSTAPLELRQWRITDPQGRVTQVSLFDLHQTHPFPGRDFEYIEDVNRSPDG